MSRGQPPARLPMRPKGRENDDGRQSGNREIDVARILVVDDEPGMRDLLAIRLHREGHTSVPASSGGSFSNARA